jgi:predicted amidohydrolase YtcJ
VVPTRADLVLVNANVITRQPGTSQAQALGIKGDCISFVGTNKDIGQVEGADTHIIDCHGKTLVPGFNDAHCHLYPLVRKLFSLDFSPAAVSSIEDIKDVIRRKVRFTPEGRWISGTDYNEFYLKEKRYPTRHDLDEVAPRNPVILTHRSMHASVLNTLALKLIGINNETEEPQGGIIDRDLENGEPNGILYEMGDYIRSRVPFSLSDAEMNWGISEINRGLLSCGITSIGEASVSNNLAQWKTYLKLKESGKLKVRICMMAGIDALDEFRSAGLSTGSGDTGVKLGSLKIILSEAKGRLNPSQPELNRKVLEATRAGFQVAIHAVERGTVESAIEALEYSQTQFNQTGRRHRIEHCSECSPDLISKLSKLNAVVVSQPPFIYYSGDRYLAQVPAPAQQWLYPFRSLMDQGIIVAGSSDAPVVQYDPLTGMYAATTRRTEAGQLVLPGEALTPRQALDMYTIHAAYSTFEENVKGTLAPGKLADIVLLSRDPFDLDLELIKNIKVEMTIIGGEVVFSAQG